MCLYVFLKAFWRAPDRSILASKRSVRCLLECVRGYVHLFVRAGCRVCRSIDLKVLLWSLAFVCQIYLSCRLSFRCHSLTHGSDRSWMLHRWENNTYLWPLELFLLWKPYRKNGLAAHASLNVYQGRWLLRREGVERHFKTGIDLQLVSGMGIVQNSQRFIACTLHVLCMDCREPRKIDSVVSSSLPGFPYELCSVLNHVLHAKLVNSFPDRCFQCLLYHA